MKKYIAELIGTFFLVLTIGCAVIGHEVGAVTPLAIGSALMVMVFVGGHISGGHFNPAVTFGVWLRGKCEVKDARSDLYSLGVTLYQMLTGDLPFLAPPPGVGPLSHCARAGAA